MKTINIDEGWQFRRGFIDSLGGLNDTPFTLVNLPHDGMISTETSENAIAGYDSGYYNADLCNYTKYVDIPSDWDGESIGLRFDGAMMHASIDVNGCKVGEHHYGYSPFYIDISDYVTVGEKNRITVNLNTGVSSSCRWYTGSGLYRSLELCHGPKVHIANDGIYAYTKEVSDDIAFVEAQIEVVNDSLENRIVEVSVSLAEVGAMPVATSKRTIQVNKNASEIANISLNIEKPLIWDIDTPNLYVINATIKTVGVYRTHLLKDKVNITDECSELFGIRTITADAIRGLRINGKTVKLKGGCIHHDNGLMGAASLYEAEVRKVRKLKEIGFNAIRTAHNPPSKALVEACDREGLYIFDEAFDAWGMAKRPGDFSMFFEKYWEQELTSFIKRDRVHPSVIMWSTGNEIPERGGLNNGYTVATKLAATIKKYDTTRPVSNGICSMWSGLDDKMAMGQNQTQNAANEECYDLWERGTEPFTNGLDVVGYNYMEDLYERNHEMFPERVILGSENFPREIGFRWPVVESLPYVIGDFTWTAWDYLGEAGIGKSLFVENDDPLVEKGPWAVMPPSTTFYPWRTANDADYDICGNLRPQGAYRSVVWGSNATHLYSQHPMHFDKTEVISMWGFTNVLKNWNYDAYVGKPIKLCVFSNADEVELIVNGKSVDRKRVSKERPLPNSVWFETIYCIGKVEAVSYKDGVYVSKDILMSAKAPSKIAITPEKSVLKADGHDMTFVNIEIQDEDGHRVSDAIVDITAKCKGAGEIAGFGTGNPQTNENYTDLHTKTYEGRASLIVRSGYESGAFSVMIESACGNLKNSIQIEMK